MSRNAVERESSFARGNKAAKECIHEYKLAEGRKGDKAMEEMIGSARYIANRTRPLMLVFDQGEIIEQGSHEQLMEKKKGLYYEMYSLQREWYQ